MINGHGLAGQSPFVLAVCPSLLSRRAIPHLLPKRVHQAHIFCALPAPSPQRALEYDHSRNGDRRVTMDHSVTNSTLYQSQPAIPHVAVPGRDQAGELWQSYTKMWTCFFGQFLGDIAAQSIRILSAPATATFDLQRHMSLTSFALILGGSTGHMWHKWLDSSIGTEQPTSTQTVLSKLALDQLAFAPLINCAFLAWLHMTNVGGSFATVAPFVNQNLLPILQANWLVWPAANFLSFKFIQQDYRILFANVLSLFWGIYISLVASALT